jgi:HD-like signal output (HDOD) protein
MNYLVLLCFIVVILLLFLPRANANKRLGNKIKAKIRANNDHQQSLLMREKLQQQAMASQQEKHLFQQNQKIPEQLNQLTLINWSNQIKMRKDLIDIICNIKRPKSQFSELLNSSYDPKEYTRILTTDPIITAKILNYVNSAAFCLQTQIVDIHHAIVYLGGVLVKNLALEVSVEDLFPGDESSIKAAYQKFWLAGNLSSLLSLRLSQKIMTQKPVQIATSAMLSFLGNLAYITAYPDEVVDYMNQKSIIDRIHWEQLHNKANAAIIGRLMAEYWQLPEKITHSIGNSYKYLILAPSEQDNTSSKEHLISYLCCRIGEYIAFNGISSINNLRFIHEEDPNYHYLIRHLEKEGLENVFTHINDNKIKNEINRTYKFLSNNEN